MIPKLLTQEQVAKMLGLSPQVLSVWRTTKRYRIPYVKVGSLVRYREDDVLAWIESRTQHIDNDEA